MTSSLYCEWIKILLHGNSFTLSCNNLVSKTMLWIVLRNYHWKIYQHKIWLIMFSLWLIYVSQFFVWFLFPFPSLYCRLTQCRYNCSNQIRRYSRATVLTICNFYLNSLQNLKVQFWVDFRLFFSVCRFEHRLNLNRWSMEFFFSVTHFRPESGQTPSISTL